jgi:hypothetical protein
MLALITFPWPVPSANAPLIAMSSRAGPQPHQPTRSAVTTGSLTSHDRDEPATRQGSAAAMWH